MKANPPGVKLPECSDHEYEQYLRNHHELIALCVQHGVTLDLASSDIVMFIEDCPPELEHAVRNYYIDRFDTTLEIS